MDSPGKRKRSFGDYSDAAVTLIKVTPTVLLQYAVTTGLKEKPCEIDRLVSTNDDFTGRQDDHSHIGSNRDWHMLGNPMPPP